MATKIRREGDFCTMSPAHSADTLRVVVGPFPEIKTGYRGFESNEIRYFVCLLVCSKIIRMAYMRQNLKLEMAFARNY